MTPTTRALVTCGVEWTTFDYGYQVIEQRDCPDCDRGLLLAPARYCSRCGGSGYLTRQIS